MVCQARAFAQRTRSVPGFDAPAAFAFLRADAQAEVERQLADGASPLVCFLKTALETTARTLGMASSSHQVERCCKFDLGVAFLCRRT